MTMYRIVLIDVMCGQGVCPDGPRIVYETTDIVEAYQKHAEYTEKYPWHKVILEQSVPRIVWEKIK